MPVLSDIQVAEHGGFVTVGMNLVAKIVRREEDEHGRMVYFQTERHGSIVVKKGPRRTQVWVEHEAPRVENGIVFRLLSAKDEEIFQTCGVYRPKNIFGKVTAEGHVVQGSNTHFKGSRFLSASRSEKGVIAYIRGMLRPTGTRRERFKTLMASHRIAAIRVAGLCERSIPCIDAERHMRGLMPHNFAASTEEVLIDGEVPAECVEEIKRPDLGQICLAIDRMFFLDMHRKY